MCGLFGGSLGNARFWFGIAMLVGGGLLMAVSPGMMLDRIDQVGYTMRGQPTDAVAMYLYTPFIVGGLGFCMLIAGIVVALIFRRR